MTDIFDEITEELVMGRSPTLNPQAVNPDIFDVEGRIIKVPESVYKYHRKRNQRMPEEYLPPEHQRTYGSSFPLPRFPEEGEQLGDW